MKVDFAEKIENDVHREMTLEELIKFLHEDILPHVVLADITERNAMLKLIGYIQTRRDEAQVSGRLRNP